MPRAKPFDKRTATTYTLLHRPQADPLIHDTSAPSQFLSEVQPRTDRLSKVKQRGDLEEEFGFSVRQNEGEAAEHGVFFDDSKYDYMQHMRDLGFGGGEATWVEGQRAVKGKGKEKKLEDLLSEASLGDDAKSLDGSNYAGSSIAPSTRSYGPQRSVFQQQQEIPDELQGFQPDTDPRLREVLEALEDEEYVDDDDDIFGELAEDEEVDRDEWEATRYDFEDEEGWESDRTERPDREQGTIGVEPGAVIGEASIPSIDPEPEDPSIPAPSVESQDLLASLAASKRGADNKPAMTKPIIPRPSDLASSAHLSNTSSMMPGKRKKRKGALTSNSGFSMTSSALARTEPLSILDSRFDKIEKEYMPDDDADDEGMESMSLASGMTGLSKASGVSKMSKASGVSRASAASRGSAWGGSQASEAPSLVSSAQFDDVMNDFLGGAEGQTKGRLMRKGGTQARWQKDDGLKQLDEVRSGLGAARVSNRYASQRA